MIKIAWMTDLHLEFADTYPQFKSLCGQLHKEKPDIILIGGDTGNSYSFGDYIVDIANSIGRPVYFVLGNHDCYSGSIRDSRLEAQRLIDRSSLARYLTGSGVVELSPHTALVGHEGWADGRLGTGRDSSIELSDYRLIEEFKGLDSNARFDLLNDLGDRAADELKPIVRDAMERYRKVVLLTHVPPFKDACWHEGSISKDDFLPHFTCKAVGDVLIEVASSIPSSSLTVLCGHTHGSGECEILPNLRVTTGGAVYGKPAIQKTLVVP